MTPALLISADRKKSSESRRPLIGWPKPRLTEDLLAEALRRTEVICRVQYFPRVAKLDVVRP